MSPWSHIVAGLCHQFPPDNKHNTRGFSKTTKWWNREGLPEVTLSSEQIHVRTANILVTMRNERGRDKVYEFHKEVCTWVFDSVPSATSRSRVGSDHGGDLLLCLLHVVLLSCYVLCFQLGRGGQR